MPKIDKLKALIEYEDEYDAEMMGDVEDTPDDEDITIQPSGQLGAKMSVYAGNKFIGEFTEDDEMIDAIRAWMHKNSWYPNVWYIDDHGGFTRYSLSRGSEGDNNDED